MKLSFKARDRRVETGSPSPLGATWDGEGVNFAIFSEHATQVELCLFDSSRAQTESHRISLPARTGSVFHGYLAGLKPGQLYGYRLEGPYDPPAGHRFNANKVVLDPYAKGVGRLPRWNEALYGYRMNDPKGDLSFDSRDNASVAPLGSVVDTTFSWKGDSPLRIPWHESVIYELHVKGMTQLHPKVPPKERGTYLGLASKPILQYLQELGITAVELLPIHQHVDEEFLLKKKLTNFWGYNTLSFFSPDLRVATSNDPEALIREFKTMVLALHDAGIEVLLDVVYNHTAEGNEWGPTLSFRGIDNLSYYRLRKNKRLYEDFSGCGNTIAVGHPQVAQWVMDSLRYWVTEMHVDGFRFDLATALTRGGELHRPSETFFDQLLEDPVLSQVKLISEPWDAGEGGYQIGNFPKGWGEWNDRYRDTVRRFWKGEKGIVPELATRLCGSEDLYGKNDRGPCASINFVTCHDGFTLQDLVSYNEKHNEKNGEGNLDGEKNNFSWNCGEEGLTTDPKIRALREKQKRNFLATLLLSQGVPMIRGGDEIGQPQGGNNNAYCQDNAIGWLDWKLTGEKKETLDFVRWMIAFRAEKPLFHRTSFFTGEPTPPTGMRDILWLNSSGQEMEEGDWGNSEGRVLGAKLAGEGGEAILFLLNGGTEPVPFVLPGTDGTDVWRCLLNTAQFPKNRCPMIRGGAHYSLEGHSLVLFCSTKMNRPC